MDIIKLSGCSKKSEIKPRRVKGWIIAPIENSDFVAHMEMTECYKTQYNADIPVVCMDESPKQLISETRGAIPAKPECDEKHDMSMSMVVSPISSW